MGSQTGLCPVARSATCPCGGIGQEGDDGDLDPRLGLRAPGVTTEVGAFEEIIQAGGKETTRHSALGEDRPRRGRGGTGPAEGGRRARKWSPRRRFRGNQ